MLPKHMLLVALLFTASFLMYGCEGELPQFEDDGITHEDKEKEEEGDNGGAAKPKKIPEIWIYTADGKSITSRSVYVSASVTIEDPDCLFSTEKRTLLSTEIRGRGNSTWDMPKKSYKLKLNKKTELLGMSDSKHWVLLANYSDKTLLRNIAAFEMSRIAGMEWTPRSRPVEVYLNGAYQGVYMLTEHVRVGEDRVEMTVAGVSGDALTGGYFVEIDSRYGEQYNFTLDWTLDKDKHRPRLPVCFVEPEEPLSAQMNYLRDYFQNAQDAIYDPDYSTDPERGYASYIDVDSFIRYFIVEEITKNVDGDMRLSTFMWKTRGGKLGFPCVWDFDITLGNCDYIDTSPYNWHIRNCIWFGQLFKDPAFVKRTTELWRDVYPRLPDVETTVRGWANLIADARKRNFQKWPILGVRVWPNVDAEKRKTYEAELEYMLDYFNNRIRWMNTEIEAGRLIRY